MSDLHPTYPLRALLAFAAALALFLICCALPLAQQVRWLLSGIIVLAALGLAVFRQNQLRRARQRNAAVLDALYTALGDLPRDLAQRMPLVMLVGDMLDQFFPVNARRLAYVGAGAIWVRVDQLRELSRLSALLCAWRDGCAPDAIILALAPARHHDQTHLTQMLHALRQASADTIRLLGQFIPCHLAVYQRLDNTADESCAPAWHGAVAGAPQALATLEAVLQAVEITALGAHGNTAPNWRAAKLASLVHWMRDAVLNPLRDNRQGVPAWPMCGIAWIDCGPGDNGEGLWTSQVRRQTRLAPPLTLASAAPWPLPQQLLAALPSRRRISSRRRAFHHALLCLSAALVVAISNAAVGNHALMWQMDAHLERYIAIPSSHDVARRAALSVLIDDRNRLESYDRDGVPLALSFGLYHGGTLLPLLNAAIATYQPSAPLLLTLDNMALFAGGETRSSLDRCHHCWPHSEPSSPSRPTHPGRRTYRPPR